MQQIARHDFESRKYAINALTWLLVAAGLVGVLDALASMDKPWHATIVFTAGVAELALAVYLRRTSNVGRTVVGTLLASSMVYLGDFILYADAYYFAIGFSVPFGAALFLSTRKACLALMGYVTCGATIALLVNYQAIQPRYESGGVVIQTVTASLLISLTTLVTMWKESLLVNTKEKEWRQRVRLNTICDNTYGAFLETDRHGNITFARGPLISEFGYTPEDILGRNHFEFVACKDRRRILPSKHPEHDEHLRYDCEIRIVDANDFERWIRLSGGTALGLDGNRKWVHALQDIQETVADRQQVFDSSRLESLSRVCGGLAHDFNNLLTVMKFHGEAIEDPQVRDEFERAQREAANLTAGMLTFARDRTLREQEVPLAGFLRDARLLTERPAPENIRFEWTNTCDEAVLTFDSAQLQQVLINLVTNACHAMPGGGVIKIAADYRNLSPKETSQFELTTPQVVQITVSDTGEGMSATTLSRATEPFFTTKKRGKGTGLGLSTVHGAVKHAGGALQISSEPTKGTQISILLPFHTARKTRAFHRAEDVVAAGSHSPACGNVILVEDRQSVAQAVQMILKSVGYNVSLFLDAESAWVKIQEGISADFLVSDVTLPGMSGIDLAKRTMNRFPDLCVVLISGHQNHDLSLVTENTDTVRFVPKPFGSKELLDAMAEIHPMTPNPSST